MRQILVANCGWFGMLAYFVMGSACYMAATILMKGSIFIGLRGQIDRRAEKGSWICTKIREMLGCLMCTATEVAIWTLGIASFGFGLWYSVPNAIVGATLETIGTIGPNVAITLPWYTSTAIMAGVSFALSLAVAGQAWGIKCIVEHREVKFLELRSESRAREIELLKQISASETAGAKGGDSYKFDLS